jgi:hypothetical protein
MLRCVVGYLKSFMSRYRTAHSPGSTARTRHAALSEKKAPEKAAQIRALWPEIKMALDTGHSHESVCECLAADGINVSARSLASYISRIRRTSPADRDRAASIRADSAVPPLQRKSRKGIAAKNATRSHRNRRIRPCCFADCGGPTFRPTMQPRLAYVMRFPNHHAAQM